MNSEINTKFIDKLKKFYSSALIHFVCLAKSNGKNKSASYYLIFAMIECYPKEISKLPVITQQTKSFKDGRLFYQRFSMPIEQAVYFYRKIKNNGYISLIWDKDGKIIESNNSLRILCHSEMKDVKNWPNFILCTKERDKNIYIADIWKNVRIHQILPIKQNEYTMNFIAHEGAGLWLEKYMTWNISCYPELIGSVNFLLPNPYYSSCHIRIIPGADSVDKVKIDFCSRNNVDISRLVVIPFERTYCGIAGGKNIQINNNSCCIDLIGSAEEFGMYVIDDDGELIDIHRFAGFIQEFKFDILTLAAKKSIHRPDSEKVDEVDLFDKISFTQNSGDERSPDKRLQEAEIMHKRKKDIDKQGIKLFYQQHDKAENFLRQLINKAHEFVMIIDPYYATNELFAYAMAVSVNNIKVEIITSSEHLKNKSLLSIYDEQNRPELGAELYGQLQIYGNKAGGEINIYVMTGDKPAIHDRFLIVDSEAWFCGGSFNEIGNRLSCIVRLPDVNALLEKINLIKSSDRVISLKEWVSNRSNSVSKDDEG